MKRFRAHRHPLLLTCVIVLFFVSLLNITTSFAQDTPFARLKISYSSSPLLSLSPDGQTLATSGVGWWEVDLWDVATGTRLTTLKHPLIRPSDTNSGIRFISFISDSTLLSATDTSSICLWDVSETFSFGTLREREDIPGNRTTDFLLSPDGQTLAYNANNDWREKSVYLWDISDGTLLKEFRNCSAGLSLTQDGQTFSFSRDGQTFLTDCETTVSLWDVSDGTLLQSFDRRETASEMSAISPDGQTLVINKTYRGPAPSPRIMELLDVSSGTLLKKFGIYYRYLTDISFSPDGKTLAVSSGGTVDLWDISTGRLRNTFKHSGRPLRIVFSPDGKTLLSGLSPVFGGVSGLGLWDVSTGRLRKVFQGSTDVRSISFIWDAQIPGGQILATAHKTRSKGLYGQNILEILLWRVGPAVSAEPEPVEAKSLLEEFIGLHKPFEAVAGVALPFDKLDDNDRVILLVNWEDIANDREDYEGNEQLDVNQDGYVNKRDLQLVEFALTLDFDAICPTPAAKSLLVEFIGLKDPLAAVAGVVPPYDILDAADATTIGVNWEDIANDRESYEGNERLDVNQDGYVNKRDLQLVEFALTLDADSDGTLSGQEMASALSGKFPLTASSSSTLSTYCPKVHVIWCYPNDVSPDVWVNRGRKVNIKTVPGIMADVHKFYSKQVLDKIGKNVAFDIDYDSNGLPHKIMLDDDEAALSQLQFNDIYDKIKAKWLDIHKVDFSQTKDFYIAILQSQNSEFPPQGSGNTGVARGNFAAVTTGSVSGPIPAISGWKSEAVTQDSVAQVIAHELGHTFGLGHLFQKHNIMAHVVWGWNQNRRADTLFGNHLTLKQAKWISNHAAFNGCPIASVSDTQIDLDLSDRSNVRIKLTDPDEIYMIQLRVKVKDKDSEDWKDKGVIEISEESGTTVELTSTDEIFSEYKFTLLQVIALDKRGDTTDEAWKIKWEEEPANAPASIEISLLPQETALLANYPNPFNPETWIPYQLATPTDVSLTIYNIQGRVVRDLTLGHQRAGMYHSRNRAAYWDGKNAQGESVASGVYFYTLTAGSFTATRKLLIRK